MSTTNRLLETVAKQFDLGQFYDPNWVLSTIDHVEKRVIIITPDLAKSLLAGTSADIQRPLKMANVKRYAKAMENGKWIMNDIPIFQDTEGNIFDGQHRLHACIMSNQAFVTQFIKGANREEIIHSLDTGVPRSIADAVAIAQYGTIPHVHTVAGAIEFLLRYDAGIHGYSGNRADTATNQDVIAWIDLNPDAFNTLMELAAFVHSHEALISCKYMTGLYFIFQAIDKKKANRFVSGLLTGVALSETSPILYIRNKFIKSKSGLSRQDKLTWREKMVLVIRAWNDYYTNAGNMASTRYSADVVSIPDIAGVKGVQLFN